jgi:error-prone DNA polymerase
MLPIMTTPEEMAADLWATGISRTYPTELLRDQLDQRGVIPAARLSTLEDKSRVTVAGIVTHRQRPGSAGGVTFLNLEDETGLINIICPVPVWTRHRRAARDSPALVIRGTLERAHNLTNILAERIERLPLAMRATSRDFR